MNWNYKTSFVFYNEEPGDSNVTQILYRDHILKSHVEFKMQIWKKAGKHFILCENNDNEHRTHSKNNLMQRYKNKIDLHYYANSFFSSDFNVIEHMWCILKQRVKQHKTATKEALKHAILVEWDLITIEEINKEVSRMFYTMEKCMNCKGLQTRY